MFVLFAVPRDYFVPATFLSTSTMLAVGYWMGLRVHRPGGRGVAAGIASALLLYLLFYGGNLALKTLFPSSAVSSESAIYSLVAAPGNSVYLQVAVLLFDAAGYESFFRGTLQARAVGRLGLLAPAGVAAVDACIHLASLNLLWVATTFVADLCWGLTYHYSKGLTASFSSHLLWDVAIFILFPIR
jgi:membrane protease YdiL (CAAX protease family)